MNCNQACERARIDSPHQQCADVKVKRALSYILISLPSEVSFRVRVNGKVCGSLEILFLHLPFTLILSYRQKEPLHWILRNSADSVVRKICCSFLLGVS